MALLVPFKNPQVHPSINQTQNPTLKMTAKKINENIQHIDDE